MKKSISVLIICITCLVMSAAAQTSLKWNDSTVNITGNKVSQSILIGDDKSPNAEHDYYYAFDKATKTHIVHMVITNIKANTKSLYVIYKYVIPATSINADELIIETAENSSYKAGGFFYLSLRCKDNKDDIITFEKSSHYYDFDNEGKTNEFSFEATLNNKADLEKLIQQIKNNK